MGQVAERDHRLDPLILWAEGRRTRTNATVARMAGVSVPTVKRRRRELRAAGALPPLVPNRVLAAVAQVSERTIYRAKQRMRGASGRSIGTGGPVEACRFYGTGTVRASRRQ